MATAPEFHIDLAGFRKDPYPVLATLREQAPIARVPELDATLICRRDDIVVSEKNIDVFSSEQPGGLMNVLMGHNMMRKDGAAHTHERKMLLPTFSNACVKNQWQQQFQEDVDKRLDVFKDGQAIDLFSDFAMPVSADALKRLTGLNQPDAAEMDAWSQAMIDGVSNYHGDPEPEQRCKAATAAIDLAIDHQITQLRDTTKLDANNSMLGAMLRAGLDRDSVSANIKLAISGGQNEPRDAIAGTVWALLTHPEQLQLILQGKASWSKAFEEYCRWLSPIGMSPRRVAKPHTLSDIDLQVDERVFFMFSSANRDEQWFEEPDTFDIQRDASKSIAFGAGPHFCIAAAASRNLACEVALPSLFRHFPNLALQTSPAVKVEGWAFRGILNLPVILHR